MSSPNISYANSSLPSWNIHDFGAIAQPLHNPTVSALNNTISSAADMQCSIPLNNSSFFNKIVSSLPVYGQDSLKNLNILPIDTFVNASSVLQDLRIDRSVFNNATNSTPDLQCSIPLNNSSFLDKIASLPTFLQDAFSQKFSIPSVDKFVNSSFLHNFSIDKFVNVPSVTDKAANLSERAADLIQTSPSAFDVKVAIAVLGIVAGFGVLYKRHQNAKIVKEKEAAALAREVAEKEKQDSLQKEIDAARVKAAEEAQNEILAKHQMNEKVLTDLGIKKWSIPFQGIESISQELKESHQLKLNAKKPTFNNETRQMLEIAKSMITQSMDTKGKIALPNLLIQGESGVGKSMLIKELVQMASEQGAGYIVIPSKMFEDHLILGTHVMAFQQLLTIAKTSKSPVYFILENCEHLFKQRPKDQLNVVEARRIELVNSFLDLTGEDKRKVSILMSTKNPNVIDEAFNTRVTPIVLQRPGADERRKIIGESFAQIGSKDAKFNQFFNLARIEQMANRTEGFTGEDLNTLIKTICDCIHLKKQLDQGIIDSSIELIKNKSA